MSARLVVVDPDFEAQYERVRDQLLVPMAEAARSGRSPDVLVEAPAAFRTVGACLAAAVEKGPRVWTPNGRWEHEGLRIVDLPTSSLDLLYSALRELSGALVEPSGSGHPAGTAVALRALDATGEGTAVRLVGTMARVLSLMDLAPDADTAVLTVALEAADGQGVRLTYAQEDAWQRLAHRLTMLLTEDAPLHRFLYRSD
ncbi:hypothetical protein [Streptomyces sp. SudanB52_2052]|uniref:hypothetical protein n=1 Tax=Streptomyces sp. SudanB52_2052 TaxID=3035276 RepID=UPI003F547ED5